MSLTFESPSNHANLLNNQLKAWFIAPETTKYRFYASCDDVCDLYFSKKAGSAASTDIERIIRTSVWMGYRQFWLDRSGWNGTPTMSDWISLTKGEKYYIEGRQSEHSGGDHFSIGVEIEKADTTGHHHAMKEVQEIGVLPPVKLHKFNITLDKPDDAGEYIVSFRSPKDNKLYSSERIKGTASASQFRSAVRGYFLWNMGTRTDIDCTKTKFDAEDKVTTDNSKAVKTVYSVTLQEMRSGDLYVGDPTITKISAKASIKYDLW